MSKTRLGRGRAVRSNRARRELSWLTSSCWSLLALVACQGRSAPEAPSATSSTSTTSKLTTAEATAQAGRSAGEEVDPGPSPASERNQQCTRLRALIERGDASVRRYAEVTPDQQGAAMEWSLVRSQAEADERSPDGTAPEVWRFVERNGWRLAVLSARLPSGGAVNESELCFRPDGTLAQGTYPRAEPGAVRNVSDLPFASLL